MIQWLIAFLFFVFMRVFNSILPSSMARSDGAYFVYGLLFALGVVFFVCGIYNTFYVRNEQIDDIESLVCNRQSQQYLKTRLAEMIDESRKLLVEAFPEHEKEIFKLISEANAEALAIVGTKFPEIQSSKLFTQMTEKIEKTNKEISEYELSYFKRQKDIRVRNRNLWVFQFFIPTE